MNDILYILNIEILLRLSIGNNPLDSGRFRAKWDKRQQEQQCSWTGLDFLRFHFIKDQKVFINIRRFSCPTLNTGQLNPLFHTFAEFRLIVNRIVARQSTDWLVANAQFSPNAESRPEYWHYIKKEQCTILILQHTLFLTWLLSHVLPKAIKPLCRKWMNCWQHSAVRLDMKLLK